MTATGPGTSPTTPLVTPRPPRRGIRGWLLCFLIVQAVFWLWHLTTITDAFEGLMTATRPLIIKAPMFRPMIVFGSVMQFVQVLGPPAGFYLVYRKSPRTPRFWTVYLLVVAAFLVLEVTGGYILATQTAGAEDAPHFFSDLSGTMSTEVLQTLRGALWALAWALYWQRSERVRNTFARVS